MHLKTPYDNNVIDNLHGINFLKDKRSIKPTFNDSDTNSKYLVQTMKLDDLNLSKDPNYIRIDIDGNELKLLNGAINYLKNPSVKSILIYLDKRDENYFKILDILKNNDFYLIDKYDHLSRPSKKSKGNRFNHFFEKKVYT